MAEDQPAPENTQRPERAPAGVTVLVFLVVFIVSGLLLRLVYSRDGQCGLVGEDCWNAVAGPTPIMALAVLGLAGVWFLAGLWRKRR